jgi:predicted ATPase/DNA-binding CsgD family transcriptional regulator
MGSMLTPYDVPIPPTELIGREREIADVVALICESGKRLLTLHGPGGIGKTRLAIAIAEGCAPSFPDGVVFVPLESISDPDFVLPTIARAMKSPPYSHQSPFEALISEIADRQLLLVLDNFEQIHDAGQQLAKILALSPNVGMLATSRRNLRIRGEHLFEVGPLTIDASSDRDGIPGPAVSLFLARAREIKPDLPNTAASLVTIEQICRRLDGFPLAIELAAARIHVLPPAALLARLDRTLPLLTAGHLDLPGRQQTMRDTIAWTYHLLTPAEQKLFRNASVFAGEFSLVEAEAIASTSTADNEASILDGLTTLIDFSLVRQQELEAEPSFQVLEMLREFGQEQLTELDELEAIRDKHANYFVNFAEVAATRLRGTERTLWLDRLERAHDNLRAAIDWSVERGDTLRAIRLAGALWQFWWWRSHVTEGRQRLETVLAMPSAVSMGPAWARALTGCGSLAETLGDYPAAERYHEQAAKSWQELNDPRGLAISLLFRWLVALNADDQDRMTALSSESLRLFREIGDPWGVAMALMQHGVLAMQTHEHATALSALDNAIEIFEQIGDAWGIAISRGVLGNVHTDRGDYMTAAKTLNESLISLLLLNDLWGVATVMPAVARMATEQGALEQAVRISGAIQRMSEIVNAPLKVPFRERYRRNLELAKSSLGDKKFELTFQEGRALTPAEAVEAVANLALPSEKASAITVNSIFWPLSPREREVLRLIPRMTAKEIGKELFISETTVTSHIKSISNKTGLKGRLELIDAIHRDGSN